MEPILYTKCPYELQQYQGLITQLVPSAGATVQVVVIICDWDCENQSSKLKQLLILSLFYHNLITIYTTTTKSSSLLQNLMCFFSWLQKWDTTFCMENLIENITQCNLRSHSWFSQAQSHIIVLNVCRLIFVNYGKLRYDVLNKNALVSLCARLPATVCLCMHAYMMCVLVCVCVCVNMCV